MTTRGTTCREAGRKRRRYTARYPFSLPRELLQRLHRKAELEGMTTAQFLRMLAEEATKGI